MGKAEPRVQAISWGMVAARQAAAIPSPSSRAGVITHLLGSRLAATSFHQALVCRRMFLCAAPPRLDSQLGVEQTAGVGSPMGTLMQHVTDTIANGLTSPNPQKN